MFMSHVQLVYMVSELHVCGASPLPYQIDQLRQRKAHLVGFIIKKLSEQSLKTFPTNNRSIYKDFFS
ncbi:hypothetical protein PGT21_020320 [Puccinia graminis f. sp. tritici]|uniref:Uncharacterized protein n=1 Tax=Puccinia graminis f. sp. tritici TaxID=56615 RepID=A0A5B0N4M4_PUCGR|nr:hypothetical protein PGT21_020320 [Puccinia graminis f. sp. tritici]